MFPKQRQRVVIGLACVLGATVLCLAYPRLGWGHPSAGLVLLHGETWAALGAVLWLLLTLVPVVAAAVVAAATGNPLSGPFVCTAALTTLAWRGGAIDSWMYHTDVPNSYGLLLAECFVWLVLLIGVLAATERGGVALLHRWPRLESASLPGPRTRLALPDVQALSAGLVCLLVGGVLALLLIRSSDRSQVIDGLVLAFMLGGLAGQLIFPQNNPVAMLLSPLLAGMVAYGWVLFAYAGKGAAGPLAGDAATQFFRKWYLGGLPGLALALPIHLASAGVMGCALGIGWAQGLQRTSEPTPATQNDPV
jgi:hypothetical protein